MVVWLQRDCQSFAGRVKQKLQSFHLLAATRDKSADWKLLGEIRSTVRDRGEKRRVPFLSLSVIAHTLDDEAWLTDSKCTSKRRPNLCTDCSSPDRRRDVLVLCFDLWKGRLGTPMAADRPSTSSWTL